MIVSALLNEVKLKAQSSQSIYHQVSFVPALIYGACAHKMTGWVIPTNVGSKYHDDTTLSCLCSLHILQSPGTVLDQHSAKCSAQDHSTFWELIRSPNPLATASDWWSVLWTPSKRCWCVLTFEVTAIEWLDLGTQFRSNHRHSEKLLKPAQNWALKEHSHRGRQQPNFKEPENL